MIRYIVEFRANSGQDQRAMALFEEMASHKQRIRGLLKFVIQHSSLRGVCAAPRVGDFGRAMLGARAAGVE